MISSQCAGCTRSFRKRVGFGSVRKSARPGRMVPIRPPPERVERTRRAARRGVREGGVPDGIRAPGPARACPRRSASRAGARSDPSSSRRRAAEGREVGKYEESHSFRPRFWRHLGPRSGLPVQCAPPSTSVSVDLVGVGDGGRRHSAGARGPYARRSMNRASSSGGPVVKGGRACGPPPCMPSTHRPGTVGDERVPGSGGRGAVPPDGDDLIRRRVSLAVSTCRERDDGPPAKSWQRRRPEREEAFVVFLAKGVSGARRVCPGFGDSDPFRVFVVSVVTGYPRIPLG